MPPEAHNAKASSGPSGGGRAVHGGDARRFLRHCHIFASTVRDVLESKTLQQVCQEALSASQLHLLKVMAANGQHQIGDVAALMGVTPPAATKTIDKLERLGLVNRTPHKDDRRATLLSVSSKGQKLARKYDAANADRAARVLKFFNKAEIAKLVELLEQFSVALLRSEASEQTCCLRCAAYIDEDCLVSTLKGGCPYQAIRHAHSGDGVAD